MADAEAKHCIDATTDTARPHFMHVPLTDAHVRSTGIAFWCGTRLFNIDDPRMRYIYAPCTTRLDNHAINCCRSQVALARQFDYRMSNHMPDLWYVQVNRVKPWVYTAHWTGVLRLRHRSYINRQFHHPIHLAVLNPIRALHWTRLIAWAASTEGAVQLSISASAKTVELHDLIAVAGKLVGSKSYHSMVYPKNRK